MLEEDREYGLIEQHLCEFDVLPFKVPLKSTCMRIDHVFSSGAPEHGDFLVLKYDESDVDSDEEDDSDLMRDMHHFQCVYMVDTEAQILIGTWHVESEEELTSESELEVVTIPLQFTKPFADATLVYDFFHPEKQINLTDIELKWDDAYIQDICAFRDNKKFFDILHPSRCTFKVMQASWYGLVLEVGFDDEFVEDMELNIPYQTPWRHIAEYYQSEMNMKEQGQVRISHISPGRDYSKPPLRPGEVELQVWFMLRNADASVFRCFPEGSLTQHVNPVFRRLPGVCEGYMQRVGGPVSKLEAVKAQIMSMNGRRWFPHSRDERIITIFINLD